MWDVVASVLAGSVARFGARLVLRHPRNRKGGLLVDSAFLATRESMEWREGAGEASGRERVLNRSTFQHAVLPFRSRELRRASASHVGIARAVCGEPRLRPVILASFVGYEGA